MPPESVMRDAFRGKGKGKGGDAKEGKAKGKDAKGAE